VYEPGTVFPDHKHGVDKVDAVVSGRFRLIIGGHVAMLGPGEWVDVPSGAIHSAAVVGNDPVVSLDAVRAGSVGGGR
jgi:quercetin dioxygenase-like cupin family protein